MKAQEKSNELDLETLKRANLYQLIEELVLSEHARHLREDVDAKSEG